MQSSYFGQIALVGMGGFVGSVARFALHGLVQRTLPLSAFPWGTLTVNVLGCLAIGFIGGLLGFRQVSGPASRLFWLVGVLGGFTTFSSFAWETLSLAQASDVGRAFANVAAQIVLGLLAAWIGFLGARGL